MMNLLGSSKSTFLPSPLNPENTVRPRQLAPDNACYVYERGPGDKEGVRINEVTTHNSKQAREERVEPRRDHDDAEDERDERDRENGDKFAAESAQIVRSAAVFACPYYKRFGPSHCSDYCSSSIAKLKQHLYRTHARPNDYCEHCFVSLDTPTARAEHGASARCVPKEDPSPQAMTRQQQTQIRRYQEGSQRRDPERAWFGIFQILFPDAPLPMSPYSETGGPKLQKALKGPTAVTEQLTFDQRTSIITAARQEVLLSWRAHSLVLSVQQELLNHLTGNAAGLTTAAGGAGGAVAEPKVQDDSTETGQKIGRRQGSAPRKRKKPQRDQGEDSDPDSEDLPDPSEPEDPPRQVMCPYSWHNSEIFSARNRLQREYRNCETVELGSIARLKQHLRRVHKRPDFYCGRCFLVVNNQAELVSHSRQEPQCPIMHPERYTDKMTVYQWDTIKEQRFSGPIPESWNTICRILFPNETLPASPYRADRLIPSPSFLRARLPAIFAVQFQLRGIPIPLEGFSDFTNEVIRSLGNPAPEQAREDIIARGGDANESLTNFHQTQTSAPDQNSLDTSDWPEFSQQDIFDYNFQDFGTFGSLLTS